MIFHDRRDAGRALARALRDEPELTDALVMALPRGGLPVAFEIAQALRLPLDVFVVRKLGTPGQEELAMGAVASGGLVVTDPLVIRAFGISEETLAAAVAKETREIERREQIYRAGRPALSPENRTVILVDDGVATGSSMKAAILALRPRVRRMLVAVPVAPLNTWRELGEMVDRLICIERPVQFYAVGEYYRHFEQTSDDEVTALLREAPPQCSRPAGNGRSRFAPKN